MTIAVENPLGAGHDLDNRIPGLSTLRGRTLGDRRVTVVILDGNPDLTLSCFRSDRISKTFPAWHERAVPITVAQHALFRQIANSDLPREQKDKQFLAAFSRPILFRFLGDRHATHITSIIAGQRGTPAPGIAPDCKVIVIPLNEAGDPGEFLSPLNLARAFDLAHDLGADIIHCAACVPTQTDAPHELLARAIQKCRDHKILIVAPAGNNAGDCRCIPAVLPGTLAVGALRNNGRPFKFSNWGGNYSIDGIMAPGEEILGAQPGTEEPIREMGTSVAAPVVTGIAALLMSRQLQIGDHVDAEAIRQALLSTARPCDPAVVDNPERCLRGVLDLPAAIDSLFGSSGGIRASANLEHLFGSSAALWQSGAKASSAVETSTAGDERFPPTASVASASAEPAAHAQVVEKPMMSRATVPAAESIAPSTAHSGLVYALGRLSFDLVSEVGEQALAQRMAQAVKEGELSNANPNDIHSLIDYLDKNPTERRNVIWTLEVDGGPIYALEPKGAYAETIYEILLQLLAEQVLPPDAPEFVERVSIPARRTQRTVELLSKAEVPVVALADVRGLYGWQINALVRDAVVSAGLQSGDVRVDQNLYDAIADFLRRVYFELRNYGVTSRDRAMNFAATNCVQAASAFARALAEGRVLETVTVEKSPVCRMHSDCWELYLTFYDPDDDKRAERVFQFTIDVSDVMPVTVGTVRSWMKRRF